MPLYVIPKSSKKFIVRVASGGTWAIWNGKIGKEEFAIRVRTRKQAEQICALLNSKDRPAEIRV